MQEENPNFFRQNAELIVFSALAALVLAIYWQTVGFNFINLDDNLYVYENQVVSGGLSWASIRWAFTAVHAANWHPVTWLSHLIDVTLFGINPGAHHATNVVFHLINTILTFVVFRRYTGGLWKSAVVAALFAVHPLHIESVAWISERKDVLSTFFWLLTMLAYFNYAGGGQKKSDSEIENLDAATGSNPVFYYLLTILLLALGLMAKPMLVTLPFVLLLLDYWSLERLKTLRDLPRLIWEKIPLFALSAVSSGITIWAQRSGGAIQSLEMLSLGTRIINAAVAYAKYIVKLFYPANLSVYYPYDANFAWWQIAGSVALLTGITALCLWQINRRKYLLMGWLWFLGTLVPVIGLVQVGGQLLADRYTYVPYFGLFIMLVWGVSEVFARVRLNKALAAAIVCIILLVLSVISFRQTSLWKNDETLYRHSVSVTKGNYLILQNYCHALMLQERFDEAEKLCREAIEIQPNYAESYNTLGIIQVRKGELDEGIENFKKTLEIIPNYTVVYSNLATAQAIQNKPEEAEASLQKAIELSGGNANPHAWLHLYNNIALAFAKQQKFDKSAEYFMRILELSPQSADVRANFALSLYSQKKLEEAQKQIEIAIRQNPNQAEAYNTYGIILLAQEKRAEAVKQFERALQVNPNLKAAEDNLEKARGKK